MLNIEGMLGLVFGDKAAGLDFTGGDEDRRREVLAQYKELLAVRLNQRSPPVITLDDIQYTLEYASGMKMVRPASLQKDRYGNLSLKDNHNGQLKLLLAEMQILLHPLSSDSKVFVYAGAAPNNKGALLAHLFNIKMIFVDPAVFDVKETEKYNVKLKQWFDHNVVLKPQQKHTAETSRSMTEAEMDRILSDIRSSDYNINIIQDYMSPTLARKIGEVFGRVTFMSDIRTNVRVEDVRDMGETEVTPDAVDIIWNSAQMISWMHEMRPVVSSIKWRFPFYAEKDDFVLKALSHPMRKADVDRARELGFDLIADYHKRKMHFYPGVNYLQAFPGSTSTEGRLVVDGKDLDKVHDYGDAAIQDAKFFYYNNIERIFVMHDHPFISEKLGVDYCNDCAIMASIFQDYIKKYDKPQEYIEWLLRAIKDTTGRSLFIGGHGKYFSPYTADDLRRMTEMREKTKSRR